MVLLGDFDASYDNDDIAGEREEKIAAITYITV